MKIISDYSDKGVEKVMLIKEVILKTVAGVYNWIQAAKRKKVFFLGGLKS